MNDLLNYGVLTMDSREIAAMTGKRHSDVKYDIETQLGQLPGGVRIFAHTYKNEQNGQEYGHFLLPKRETLILVSGYSVELRAAIIDRWAELEAQNGPVLPQTFAQALQLAADQAKALEEQALQLSQQKAVITQMTPKAEFFDAVTNAKSSIPMGDVAKNLDIPEMGRNKLFAFLREQKILQSDNRPYQSQIDAGHFRVVQSSYQTDYGLQVTFTTMVYPKGMDYILKRLADEGYYPRENTGLPALIKE